MKLNKRFVSFILSIVLIFTQSVSSFADGFDAINGDVSDVSEYILDVDDLSGSDISSDDVSSSDISISSNDIGISLSDNDESDNSDLSDTDVSENDISNNDISDFDFSNLNFGYNARIEDYEIEKVIFEESDYINGYGESLESLYEASSYVPEWKSNSDFHTRDQNPFGSCWAHASSFLGEISMYKQGYALDSYDFSETALCYFSYNTVVDPLGGIAGDSNDRIYNKPKDDDPYYFLHLDNPVDAGGSAAYAGQVLATWTGSTAEAKAPYSNAGAFANKAKALSDSLAYDDVAHLRNMYEVNIKTNPEAVKKLVVDNGGVAVGYFAIGRKYDDPFYNGTYNSIYTPLNFGSNHAVVIVGWDDNFSKDHFTSNYLGTSYKPEGDGAWLIRNSWSLSGVDYYGYFWLSYYDKSLREDGISFVFDPADRYDHNYQYDGGVITGWSSFRSSTVYAANIFNVPNDAHDQILKAVSIYTVNTNLNYEVKIYKNPTAGKPSSGTLVSDCTTTGHFTYQGYNTIELNAPLSLTAGDSFSVVIKLSSVDGSVTSFAYEVPQNEPQIWIQSTVSNEAGQSFFSSNGTYWTDMYTQFDGNVRIKAFTCDTDAEPVEVTVSFHANGGSGILTPKQVTVGKAYGLLCFPSVSRTGYTFDGWYTEQTGGTKVTELTKVTIASNHMLYAHWTPNSYVVNFDANGGTVSTKSKPVTYDKVYGTLPVSTRSGFAFDGWYTEKIGGDKVDKTTVVTTAEDHTLYAHWDANKVTVNLDGNGGSSFFPRTLSYMGTYGELPDSVRTGYTFLGWYTAKSGGTKVEADTVVNTLSEHTLYAHWAVNSYTVSFNPGAGTASFASKNVTFESAYGQLPTATPASDTLVFVGWFTEAEENSGKQITAATIMDTAGNHTLYAHYELKKFTVRFDSNGGSTVNDAKEMRATDSYGILPVTTRYGYNFDGWYTADGTLVTSTMPLCPDENSAVLTLVARWNPIASVVTFDANGGTVSEVLRPVEFGAEYGELPVPVKVGFTFLGWHLENESDYIEGTGIVNQIVDHTLYADWEANKCLIHFDSCGGLGVADIIAEYNEVLVNLPECSFAGYEFQGWYTDPVAGELITNATISQFLEEEVTLYAHWQLKYVVSNPFVVAETDGVDTDGITPLVEKGTVIYLYTETNGALIYYTTDGSVPDLENVVAIDEVGTHLYEDGIVVTEDITINAIAVKENYRDSDVLIFNYKIKPAVVDWGDLTPEDIAEFGDVTMVPANLWVRGIVDKDYTGAAVTQDVRVYKGLTKLELNKDYTIKYSNNVKAGTATVTITGKGNYAGTIVKTFAINPLDISAATAPDILLAYNKKLQKGTTTVTYMLNGKKVTLKAGVDFVYSYPKTNAKEADYDKTAFVIADDYTVTITGKGNYTGTLTFNEKITEKTLISKMTVASIPNQPYKAGAAIEPVIKVSNGKTPLTEGQDYTVSYANNTDLGTASVTITAVDSGNYIGTKTVTFKIVGSALKSAKINGIAASYNWTGSPIEVVKGTVPEGETATLTYVVNKQTINLKGILKAEYDALDAEAKRAYDYYYEYIGNTTEIGTVKVNFTGVNGYTGVVSKSYKIIGTALSKVTVDYTKSFVYDKTVVEPDTLGDFRVYIKATRTTAEIPLTKGVDYTVSYLKNDRAGTATMVLTGINGYSGVVKKNFTIGAYDYAADWKLEEAGRRITVEPVGTVVYCKGGAKPMVTVKDGETVLTPGVDYVLSYSNNTKLSDGTGKNIPTVKITGKGNYKNAISVPFAIEKKSFSDVSITAADVVYQNKVNLKPVIKITDTDGKLLVAGTDYDKNFVIKYAKDVTVAQVINKKTVYVVKEEGEIVDPKLDIIPVGAELTVTVKAINNYTGDIEANFKYISADMSKATVSVKAQVYTGREVKPNKDDITVKYGKTTLAKTDYEIIGYTKNVAKGTAQLTIKGVGNYGGIKTVPFVINSRSMNYTVVYCANASDATGTMKNSVTPVNGKVTANSFKRNGYSFAGWSTTPGQHSVEIKNQGALVLGDVSEYGTTINLYAQWTPVKYKFTYNLNGGKFEPVFFPTGYVKEYTIVDDIVLPSPTKNGYTFAGWYYDSKLSKPVVANKISADNYGNKAFYAKWTKLVSTDNISDYTIVDFDSVVTRFVKDTVYYLGPDKTFETYHDISGEPLKGTGAIVYGKCKETGWWKVDFGRSGSYPVVYVPADTIDITKPY